MNRRAWMFPTLLSFSLVAMTALVPPGAAAAAIALTSAGPVGGGPAHPQGSGHQPVPTTAVADAPLIEDVGRS